MAVGRFSLDPGFRVFVQDLRLSWPRVLRRAGLSPVLASDGAPALLTPAEYFALWTALQDEAGDRDLAVDVGSAVSPETFSPPILAALTSPNLSMAAERIATYKPLVGPLTLDVTNGRHGLRIAYSWPRALRPPTLLTTSELVFWVALARTATRHHVRPTNVTIPEPPVNLAGVEAFLGARIRRGDRHTITFAEADADRPFLTQNEALWNLLAPDLRERLTNVTTDTTVTDRVQAALHETLPAGDSSIQAVARHLNLSPRTLQRQLQSAGTSYQDLLANTRQALARQYLDRGDLRSADIAYLLGYDDTNSFYRAFRSWTGRTPKQVRAQV